MSSSPSSIVLTADNAWLFAVEGLLALAGAAVLLRGWRETGARLRGVAPARLAPSPLRASDLFLVAAFAFGGSVAFQALATWLAPRFWPKPPDGETGLYHIVIGAAFQLGLIAGVGHAWFWHLRGKKPAPDAASPVVPTPAPPLRAGAAARAGVLTFVALLAVLWPLNYAWKLLLDRLGLDAPAQDLVTAFLQSERPVEIAVVFFFAVVVAPLAEELLFRVGLFRWLRGRAPRAVALLAPALVFAALHPYLAVVAPLFVFAIMLSLAYERSGHPLTPIVAHSLFNLHTLLLALVGWPV